MHYLIGDLQGCSEAFEHLLAETGFSASRDSLTLLGDLVNRGPGSLAVMRRVRALGTSAQAILGNHDLHLLAVACGARKARAGDTIQAVLDAEDATEMLQWLRHRPLAVQVQGWLCVHAGISPSWDAAQTLTLAAELSSLLRGDDHAEFFHAMYGDEPARWHDDLRGMERARHLVNVLTRMRFCSLDGTLELATKEGAAAAPKGFMPWFEVPSRRTQHTRVAFGHWSTLGLINRENLLGLDTGCVWGGSLSAARVDGPHREIIQLRCPQAQRPAKNA